MKILLPLILFLLTACAGKEIAWSRCEEKAKDGGCANWVVGRLGAQPVGSKR